MTCQNCKGQTAPGIYLCARCVVRLEDVLTQVKAEAWDEGWTARGNHDHHTNMSPAARAERWSNPYREEEG